jgi:hypothetical protein
MYTINLNNCDRSNFIPLKFKIYNLLEELEIWEHINKDIVAYLIKLATQVKEAKVERIILDSMNNHFIPQNI